MNYSNYQIYLNLQLHRGLWKRAVKYITEHFDYDSNVYS